MAKFSNPLTCGDMVGGIDITLRLGSPCQHSTMNQHNVQRSSTNPDEKLKSIPKTEDVEDGSYSSRVAAASEILIHLHQNITVNNPSLDHVAATTLLRINNHVTLAFKVCNQCGKKDTPLWRKGPNGPKTLCNACGLRYARARKMRRTT